MDGNCIKKTCCLETKTHSEKFWDYERERLCPVAGGKIIDELGEGAFRISLEGGMIMEGCGKDSAEKQRN